MAVETGRREICSRTRPGIYRTDHRHLPAGLKRGSRKAAIETPSPEKGHASLILTLRRWSILAECSIGGERTRLKQGEGKERFEETFRYFSAVVLRFFKLVLIDPNVSFDAELFFEGNFEKFKEAPDPCAIIAMAVTDEDVVIKAGKVGHGSG